ncbi:GNAT family N-acetyltransferase [Streptomyces sp. SP18CS02]|uniref:GNAT family N-acetyltransferase n=1 Tax=Streptomyces sp. SP18CS02 TaxID=3002531 RepID=UPI002E76BEDD|nr:GNAT family N-acetyltransferase [Streptomyces sp. SP18CS02]MEE1751844.1 GNAT family N-acetyltransferase [Streptomyces sp. SP18CS02]
MTSVERDAHGELLDLLERYYDAVPRSGARAEDFGPLTLFVREGEGWPFYARPALGASEAVTAADVLRVRERQRELGLPESFEWVAESAPALRGAVEGAGLTVHEHPLMALGAGEPTSRPGTAEGVVVRVVGPGDPVLPSALALPHVAFAAPGTVVGTAGAAELRQAVADHAGAGAVENLAERIKAGLTLVAVAESDGEVLCVGQHQPVGPVSEIVGVGTLPSARRRGLGQAVTAALVADARARGVETLFLSAGDEDVARVYARIGFRPVGTALIAEPAE